MSQLTLTPAARTMSDAFMPFLLKAGYTPDEARAYADKVAAIAVRTDRTKSEAKLVAHMHSLMFR